jgi:hypothetical protein
MSIFSDIPKKITDWIGVPGLIIAFSLALVVWLYYDLVIGMTLNSSMVLGLSTCSLLIVAFIKIVIGLLRGSSSAKEDEVDEE